MTATVLSTNANHTVPNQFYRNVARAKLRNQSLTNVDAKSTNAKTFCVQNRQH